MDDREILQRIHELVAREHEDRDHPDRPGAQGDLRRVEEALDQCWDLLRQRRARREFAQDPDAARSRPVGDVETYLQ